MQQKVEKLKKDGNKAAKGGNWPVFDFCNQFLQVLLYDDDDDNLVRVATVFVNMNLDALS